MSHYIRRAIKQYSDSSTVCQFQLIKALRHFYHTNSDALSQVSDNLNNAVKRANDLAISGHLTQTYLYETLLPQIITTRIFLEYLTRQLLFLTKIQKYQ